MNLIFCLCSQQNRQSWTIFNFSRCTTHVVPLIAVRGQPPRPRTTLFRAKVKIYVNKVCARCHLTAKRPRKLWTAEMIWRIWKRGCHQTRIYSMLITQLSLGLNFDPSAKSHLKRRLLRTQLKLTQSTLMRWNPGNRPNLQFFLVRPLQLKFWALLPWWALDLSNIPELIMTTITITNKDECTFAELRSLFPIFLTFRTPQKNGKTQLTDVKI